MPLPITNDDKTRLTYKVYSLFVKHGFDGISMDEVAKQIKISKATLYKYFKSKEDIVRNMVNETKEHLDAVQFTSDEGINGVLKSVSTLYFKAILTAAYTSSKFIADLQSKFPDIYAGYISALDSVQTRFAAYYACTVEAGYFKQLSIKLVGEQFKMMLPVIIHSDYLSRHNTTLQDVIREYYKLLLYQILSENYMAVTEKDSTYSFVDELVEILKSNFSDNQNIPVRNKE